MPRTKRFLFRKNSEKVGHDCERKIAEGPRKFFSEFFLYNNMAPAAHANFTPGPGDVKGWSGSRSSNDLYMS